MFTRCSHTAIVLSDLCEDDEASFVVKVTTSGIENGRKHRQVGANRSREDDRGLSRAEGATEIN